MSFYKSISDNYDRIFPLNNAQLAFIESEIEFPKEARLLDIGCGTGSLSIALGERFKHIVAVDLDEDMLKAAAAKPSRNVNWKVLNMLDIENKFRQNSFDAVICFGNTLVHLDGLEEVNNFLRQSKHVLMKGGKLLFQIINYDRIIDQEIDGLPTIENDQISFVRQYTYKQQTNRIAFQTQLTLKHSGKEIKNTVQLYPLRKEEIVRGLKDAGFEDFRFYGNFKKDRHQDNSLPLIVSATSKI